MLWDTLWGLFMVCGLILGIVYSVTHKYESKRSPCMLVCSACGRCRRSQRIIDAYREDPDSALKQYGGQEMEFTGTVVSCIRTFSDKANPWDIRINASDIDVIGQFREIFPVGREITMWGTCAGLRSDTKVAVVLNPAKAR